MDHKENDPMSDPMSDPDKRNRSTPADPASARTGDPYAGSRSSEDRSVSGPERGPARGPGSGKEQGEKSPAGAGEKPAAAAGPESAEPAKSAPAIQEKLTLDPFLARSEGVMYLFLVHGIYYILTGIWPLLDVESFMAVTGPKMDIWLVRAVGVVVLAAGSGFLLASLLRAGNRPLILIAAASSLGLAAIDIRYVISGVISTVYLVDAVLQLLLLLVWVKIYFRVRKEYVWAKREARRNRKELSSRPAPPR